MARAEGLPKINGAASPTRFKKPRRPNRLLFIENDRLSPALIRTKPPQSKPTIFARQFLPENEIWKLHG
jgi:hypothetical protein